MNIDAPRSAIEGSELQSAPEPMKKIEMNLFQPEVSSCGDEEIRIPGSIQAHGFLLLLDETFDQIVVASNNAGTFLGTGSSALLGKSIALFLEKDLVEALRHVPPHPVSLA